jgi:hypothetical protein
VRTLTGFVAMLVTTGAMIAPASAQDDAAPEVQMTLPAGRVLVEAFFEANLSKELVFKPFSIAPDIWYGVSDELTVGLVHSSHGAVGSFGGAGAGLCLAGKDNGCAKVYNNIGIDARYHVWRQPGMALAVDGGLYAGPFDPFTLSVKLGAVGRWQGAALSAELAPSIFIGMTQREPEDGGAGVEFVSGNKEIIHLPLSLFYAVMPKLGVGGQLFVRVPTSETADTWNLGGSLGAQYHANEKLRIDAAFTLPLLAGGDALETGADVRTMTLGVGYAL